MTKPTPEGTLVAPAISQAEIEAVRKRHAFDQNNYELTASESGLGYLSSERGPRQHSDRALLLQALDGVMGKLTEDVLIPVLCRAPRKAGFKCKYPDCSQSICSDELKVARAIRASLGITPGSGER